MAPPTPILRSANCAKCNKAPQRDMLVCTKCDKQFHGTCVPESISRHHVEWKCADCILLPADVSTPKSSAPTPENSDQRRQIRGLEEAIRVTQKNYDELRAETTKLSGSVNAEFRRFNEALSNQCKAAQQREKNLQETIEAKFNQLEENSQTQSVQFDEIKRRFEENSQIQSAQLGEILKRLERHSSPPPPPPKIDENAEVQNNSRVEEKLNDDEAKRLEAQRIEEARKRAEDEAFTKAIEEFQLVQQKQLEELYAKFGRKSPMGSAADISTIDLSTSTVSTTNQLPPLDLKLANDSKAFSQPQSAPCVGTISAAPSFPVTSAASTMPSLTSASLPSLGNVNPAAASALSSTVDIRQQPQSQMFVAMNRRYIRKLPIFDGDEKLWPAFFSIYNSTTMRGQFTEEENIDRLKEALRPPASNLVLYHLTYSFDAKGAMETLQKAYGRPEVVVVKLLDELIKHPSLNFPTNIRIQQFSVDVKTTVASIKALGREKDLESSHILEKLSAKLAWDHLKEWNALKNDRSDVNLETFSDFVEKKVQEIPPASFSTTNPLLVSTDTSSGAKSKRVNVHRKSEKKRECLRCKANHPLWSCDDFKRLSIQDRWTFVTSQKICNGCLKSNFHQAKDCRSKSECGQNGCKKFHHPLLHNSESQQRGNSSSFQARGGGNSNPQARVNVHSAPGINSQLSSDVQPFIPRSQENSNQIANAAHQEALHQLSHLSSTKILYKIVPVRIYSDDREFFIDTWAFLDDGSGLTLVEREIFDELNLKGSPEKLELLWTSGVVRHENSIRAAVTIGAIDKKERYTLSHAYSVENLGLPSQTMIAAELKSRFPHLRGLPLPDLIDARPKILIGLKQCSLLTGKINHIGEVGDPIASKTPLGWIVYGPSIKAPHITIDNDLKHRGSVFTIQATLAKDDSQLHQLVKNFFSIDHFGIVASKTDLTSEETRRANFIMENSLKFLGDRYEIGLLWKTDDVNLPDSYPMALKRLEAEEKSLVKKDLLEWKNQHIRDLVDKGYARVATEEELTKKWPRVWYCPRFVVINPNKQPPKPRDVADVAAKVAGVSLNDFLLKGPDNLTPLLKSLMKVREDAVAFNADVKEMFHQVRITEPDQQCQRFLWRDGDSTRPPTTYVMQSMMFGPTSSPACAQFVKNTHAKKHQATKSEAVECLTEFTYVDDALSSYETVDRAVEVATDAISICAEMGFDLIGFQSNSQEFLSRLPSTNVKNALVSMTPLESESYITKILGMYWQTFTDVFKFKVTSNEILERMLDPTYSPTKREVLKTLMRIFDPLGLIAHFIIRGKIIMQEIWRDGTGWDQPIESNQQSSWYEFVNELQNIEKIAIPRQFAPTTPSRCHVKLVTFVDASEQAYAATGYFIFSDGQTHVAHVMGKAKVAPVKRLTIPQLELMAAVLGIRLATTIKNLASFKIHEIVYLSDSKTVLAWICSKTYRFKSFVAVRIGEILDASSRKDWFYVPSKENVADDATKWSDPSMKSDQTRWFKGASFLNSPFEQWPVKPAIAVDEDEKIKSETCLMIHRSSPASDIYRIIDDMKPRFLANWKSLVNVLAFILRFITPMAKRESACPYVQPSEASRAENLIFKKIQLEAFPQLILELQSSSKSATKRKSTREDSSLNKLSPFLNDDGVLRMSSRSQRAKTSYAARNPAILPNKHRLVDLLIVFYHEKNFHLAEDTTIADIRERAWIIDIRQAVRRVKSSCQLCKIMRAIPRNPKMAPLPDARIDFGEKPFFHTGIDAFGPLEVKHGRGKAKRYGLIFTCMTFRAVHIELVNDMSTDQCLMAIRRFLCRRGHCDHFYSDNGKNFVGAHNTLNSDLKAIKNALGEELANKFRIQWHFQPAYSPWFGGAWERLIQSIKKCVNFLLKDELPREDVLQNALTEAELLMNRRPLTHIPIDHDDAMPLTPYTVLHGNKNDEKVLAPGNFDSSDASSTRAHRRAQHLVNKYMSRWTREYLPQISRRDRWQKDTDPLKIGDIVIIIEPNEPRNAWHKGRVIKIHPGKDGIIRSADVALANGTIKSNRSTGRLIVLDVKK